MKKYFAGLLTLVVSELTHHLERQKKYFAGLLTLVALVVLGAWRCVVTLCPDDIPQPPVAVATSKTAAPPGDDVAADKARKAWCDAYDRVKADNSDTTTVTTTVTTEETVTVTAGGD